MRLVATTTQDSVILSLTGDGGPKSVSLPHSVAGNMTVPEAIGYLFTKLGVKVPEVVKPKGIVEVEIVEPVLALVEEFELEGDEDDEDLSLYEDVVESPAEYLAGLGII